MGRNKKHGLSTNPLYSVYQGMMRRCYDTSHKNYHNYGGRGIDICDEWRNDMVAFITWAESNGYAKGLQIDRENNNLGYSPENCRFVTPVINSRNRRVSRYITFSGETRHLAEWCEILGLGFHETTSRIFMQGWPIDAAFSEGIKFKYQITKYNGRYIGNDEKRRLIDELGQQLNSMVHFFEVGKLSSMAKEAKKAQLKKVIDQHYSFIDGNTYEGMLTAKFEKLVHKLAS